MDFVSTALVTVSQKSGFWQNILNTFKNGLGTYILAVIMIALIVRVIFSLVDIINKKVNMKNSDITAKMKPELDAIKARYGNDPALMQQKTNEIYRKYQFSMMGSCLPMLLIMALQMVVFFTLWSGLQSVSNYNIAKQYQDMKIVYANIVDLNENAGFKSVFDAVKADPKYSSVTYDVDLDKELNKLTIYVYGNYTVIQDGTESEEHDEHKFEIELSEEAKNISNEQVHTILAKYVLKPSEEVENGDGGNNGEEGGESTAESLTIVGFEETQDGTAQPDEGGEAQPGEQQPEIVYTETGMNEVLKELAEKAVKYYFEEHKEGFLWIKNIYKSESPTSPMFTKSEVKKYISSFYTKEEKEIEKAKDFESGIYDCVIGNNNSLEAFKKEKNGYYILTIIAVLTCFLSLWLSNKLMKNKTAPAQKQPWAMYVIMPIIYGMFTFSYTSLFAVYLIVGQIVVMVLTPLTTWIVRKWNQHDDKKKQEKETVVVDYRRKDM